MTSLNDWTRAVELDVPKEAQSLHDAIDKLQGNTTFEVNVKTNNGNNEHIITKRGFKPILEIKSPLARNKMLNDISVNLL